jgi:hypothetical protein
MTPPMHPKQKLIFSSMTPEEKLRVALRLYYSARELKSSALRAQHPDWTDAIIQQRVRELFLYAGT